MATRRPRRPVKVGEHVHVWSEHEGAVLAGTVTDVRWDAWLAGGTHRIFVAVDGRFREDGSPVVETYFTTADLREAPPAAPEPAWTPGRGSLSDLRLVERLSLDAGNAWGRGMARYDKSGFVDALGDLALMRRAVESAAESLVREARGAGASWDEIGAALGITRQGARQRYGKSTAAPAAPVQSEVLEGL